MKQAYLSIVLLHSVPVQAQFFGPQQDLVEVDPYPDNITAGDLDGDGDLDLVFSTEGTSELVVAFNSGGMDYSQQHILASAEVDWPLSIQATDLDADGVPDLLSAGLDDSRIAWYENLNVITCDEDINEDGVVDVEDFISFNSAYGTICGGCREDINGDQVIDILDFLQLNSKLGQPCE